MLLLVGIPFYELAIFRATKVQANIQKLVLSFAGLLLSVPYVDVLGYVLG